MREINWKKFIYIDKNHKEGMAIPKSIITYMSKPWEMETIVIRHPDPLAITARYERRVTKSRKLLIIDLWFVEIKIDWVKKISYPHSNTCVGVA
jgi:hypothetical protein